MSKAQRRRCRTDAVRARAAIVPNSTHLEPWESYYYYLGHTATLLREVWHGFDLCSPLTARFIYTVWFAKRSGQRPLPPGGERAMPCRGTSGFVVFCEFQNPLFLHPISKLFPYLLGFHRLSHHGKIAEAAKGPDRVRCIPQKLSTEVN